MIRTRILLILGATLAFSAVLVLTLFSLLGKGEDGARNASTQFATAVVTKNPSLAPKGAREYVEGVQARFGTVSSARVIDARNTSHGSGSSSHTYWVADVLLTTEKGPAVVELDFNGGFVAWGTETVTDVEELAPVDVPDDSLNDTEFVALAKAFQARGGEPATSSDLDDELAEPETLVEAVATPTKKERAEQRAQKKTLREASKQLDCVKKARGDVEKLTRCASI